MISEAGSELTNQSPEFFGESVTQSFPQFRVSNRPEQARIANLLASPDSCAILFCVTCSFDDP